MLEACPDSTIVGHVTVTVTMTVGRALDLKRGKKPKPYTYHLSGPFVGSDFLVHHFCPEMQLMMNEPIKKVRAWEFRAREAEKKEAQIHKRPGT